MSSDPSSTPATPRTVMLPRAFSEYRCERSMFCCHTLVAPVDEAEEALLRAELARSEAGRAILPVLAATIETRTLADGTPLRRWRQAADGACLHLSRDTATCELHRAAGLAALPVACRNFPRLVTDEGTHVEVTFDLSCPTAARLLTEDSRPYALVSRPAADDPYRPVRVSEPAPAVTALRDAWWRLFAAVRGEAERLVAAIGALLVVPLSPPAHAEVPPPQTFEDAIAVPATERAALAIAHALGQHRRRGSHYEPERPGLVADLQTPWSARRAVLAASATPDLVAVHVEHGVGLMRLRQVAAATALRLAGRRALCALRVVDTLCDRVPLRTAVLFADAYQVTAQLDPEA